MSDRLRRALARALDEDSADVCPDDAREESMRLSRKLVEPLEAEQERDSERRQAQFDKEHAEDAKRRERELVALERISYSLQQLSESVSRLSVSGLQVHGHR